MAEKKKIGLAIIGVRGIGGRHARAALASGLAELRACAARTRDSVEGFAPECEIPCRTTDVKNIARRNDVDAVVICTPNRLHAPQARAMLEAGKDVLLEKPMALNATEAMKIMRAARRHRRVLMVGHMWRFAPEVNYVRGLALSGELGRAVKTKAYAVHVNWGPSGWFTQKRQAGGGALIDMGIHAIDTTRFILGDPEPCQVYARIGTFFGDYDVDDEATIMITWEGSTVSVIECGWRNPHSDRPPGGVQVFFERGYAETFPPELSCKVEGRPGIFYPRVSPDAAENRQLMYDRQMEHFLGCVKNRKEPSPGGGIGLINMRIVDAAYRSARTGQAVGLRGRSED